MFQENMYPAHEGQIVTSDAWKKGEEYRPAFADGEDAPRLPSGRPDFDARNVFPASVVDLYALRLDERRRDQYGVLWKNGATDRLTSGVNAIRTAAAVLLAHPKEVEKDQWPAIVESLQHHLIAHVMMKRKKGDPDERIGETREFFEGVALHPFGMGNPRMKEVVRMVNARHAAYGVRDRQTESIYPHMKRAFKYVTMLYALRMQAATAERSRIGGMVMGSAGVDLFNNADTWLGMREAPVDPEHFLQVEDALIDRAEVLLERENPKLLDGLKRTRHQNAVDAIGAAARMQGISTERVVQTLSEKTRKRLLLQ